MKSNKTRQLLKMLSQSEDENVEGKTDLSHLSEDGQIAFWMERGVPSAGNLYRAVEDNEFPMAAYIKNKTGRLVTHWSRLFDDMNYATRIHHPDDVDTLTKEFGFRKLFSSENYDGDLGRLVAKQIWELADKSGVVLLHVSGYPIEIGKAKRNEDARVAVMIFSNAAETLYETIRNRFVAKLRHIKLPSNNVHLVISSNRGYDTEPFDLPKSKIDISLNYGKEFEKIHKKIINTLNTKNGKGLVLLHGEPGTGKTHYLKHLASKIKDKKVLFIPPYLADFITSPEMTPFLIDNANSVLFIEDAERVITDRSENGSTGVSNILNITDGILSDILKIQIVATFNMDKQKIDSALLRKGRLIAEHKFEALSVEDTNRLLDHLGITHTNTKRLTLTEIYNYNDTHYVSEPKPTSIGFGMR